MLSIPAGHSSVRHFEDRAVDDDLVELVCDCALSVPSKSDLQLRDIIVLKDPSNAAGLSIGKWTVGLGVSTSHRDAISPRDAAPSGFLPSAFSR